MCASHHDCRFQQQTQCVQLDSDAEGLLQLQRMRLTDVGAGAIPVPADGCDTVGLGRASIKIDVVL